MQNIAELSLKEITLASINKKLILQGIGWDFYEKLLEEYKDSNELNFAYDNGFLEVEVPLFKHERPSNVLHDLVTLICAELDIDVLNAGSTTFCKRAKGTSCEPDIAFYIQNEFAIRGKSVIDLSKDPPPDLVIEVDITSPSLNKLPIYAALGIAEIWIYNGKSVEFLKLIDDKYTKIDYSISLSQLSSEEVTEFLEKGLAESSTKWIKEIRDWAKH